MYSSKLNSIQHLAMNRSLIINCVYLIIFLVTLKPEKSWTDFASLNFDDDDVEFSSGEKDKFPNIVRLAYAHTDFSRPKLHFIHNKLFPEQGSFFSIHLMTLFIASV